MRLKVERRSSRLISPSRPPVGSAAPANASPGISSNHWSLIMDQSSLAPAPAPNIVVTDLTIPSDTAGIALHLRNKRLAGVEAFAAERTILMLHGATYSSASL